jgi:putative ABC transport system substrate-binding protein
MRRRDLITLLGGAAAWPLAASAQGDRVRRVGVLISSGERDPETQLRVGALREGLQKLGWAEGRNFKSTIVGGPGASSEYTPTRLSSWH